MPQILLRMNAQFERKSSILGTIIYLKVGPWLSTKRYKCNSVTGVLHLRYALTI